MGQPPLHQINDAIGSQGLCLEAGCVTYLVDGTQVPDVVAQSLLSMGAAVDIGSMSPTGFNTDSEGNPHAYTITATALGVGFDYFGLSPATAAYELGLPTRIMASTGGRGPTQIGQLGQSVRRGRKWYKKLMHWGNDAIEAERLKNELESDRMERDTAFMQLTNNSQAPVEFIEIEYLAEQNLDLDYDVIRLTGKLMGEVPHPPGIDQFGDDAFNYYGGLRDANNSRIDQLLQEILASH